MRTAKIIIEFDPEKTLEDELRNAIAQLLTQYSSDADIKVEGLEV